MKKKIAIVSIGYVWFQRTGVKNQRADRHGDLDMPYNYVDENGNSLATWLRNQKNTFHCKTNAVPLTVEQIQKLEAIGVRWTNKYEDIWQKWYALAELYYKEHGDLQVCSTYCINGEALGKWLNAVRLTRKPPETSNRRLTEECIRQLDAIGMVWE